MARYTFEDLRKRYDTFTGSAIVSAELATELVGGISADADGIRAFVEHHLHLKGPEAEEAINRIMKDEIGEKDVPFIGNGEEDPDKKPKSAETELKEKLTYGVNVIRRDVHGPWLGNWMVKACIKGAASRLALFQQKRGTKGDIAEMGLVEAWGCSRVNPNNPERIYLRDATGNNPAQTYFQQFKGRVNTPSGSKSIVNDAECAPPGSLFEFRLQWYDGKLTEANIVDIFAAGMVIGIGSAKALERGKFKVLNLDIDNVGNNKKAGAE